MYVSLNFTINQFCKKYLQHLLVRILSLTNRCNFVYKSNICLKILTICDYYISTILFFVCVTYMVCSSIVGFNDGICPPFSVERTSAHFSS